MPNINKDIFRQEHVSGSGQRSRTINYKHLSDFNDKSCMVYTIDIPDIGTSETVHVLSTDAKAVQHFHTTERREAVFFKVCYTPYNNANGKKLLTNVKKLVDSVLTKKFQPEPATINLMRNGKIERTINILETVIVDGSIIIDLHDFVRIVFTLSGLRSDS